ncbi:MAG: hypothetical protein UR25_C0001G0064 [Candidatus Nomurabacteria bacterium GW2011_GWE1_32_28]|uniref:TrbC/VIRB2 family protein n=1 Tax=Candidatus Nomurabacteria bacterium GW2011_GWF1_31_48 TaxID=1618767 RepID=A0A0F9YGW8_9BACT|nr:MAG: hypothetical protein UR10_C0001G0017 [Candidatus Nomurabacteria bacterium GW2011_GWF2_30_133]KKP28895.1 MAG: hypothetical protein UR18_C0001G0016 [Candidatus Nomurabacteria bacterium GW2011_GWE2_31_40]KKP30633.1 MAG: hypothetical protein UR19_C0001G0017 [Candidatus Nomurabacteria bacterium GW2011_GWF1_31_48]KKP35151.1 MAG: hypothetical protein UR25_C0001G0064 [Candidatus Nomurabacteria bacterium GW2011_GWE1_32_28]HAS80461.1 hypothetical protein [Candidatus Nomurabacteria bacterium]
MKYIKKNLDKFNLIVLMFILPVVSFAEGEEIRVENPIQSETLIDLIKTILEGLIKIGMPIIVLAVIYSGFLFVAAQGNSEKLSEAKRSLVYTLIGAAILLGSWAIAQLIADTVKAL